MNYETIDLTEHEGPWVNTGSVPVLARVLLSNGRIGYMHLKPKEVLTNVDIAIRSMLVR